MDIKIKKLIDPYPYSQIGQLLKKTYFEEYTEDAGALQWSEKYAKFYFDAIYYKESSRDFLFGAFDGNKLIGTIFGHRDKVCFEDKLELEMVNLGLTAVDPKYRRQGIAKDLISKLIEHAKEKNIDFIMSFPEKGRFGNKLLKDHFGFNNYGKTDHLIKIMEDFGLENVKELLGLNPVVAKVATLYSKIPDLEITEGKIREGNSEDLGPAVNILNSYRSRVPISMIYHKKEFNISNQGFYSLNERFGDPWGFYWKVLEINNKVLATISYRIEEVKFKKEEKYLNAIVALLTSLAFHEDVEMDQKKEFLGNILRQIRTDVPTAFLTQITSPQHELKLLKKLKFINDRNKYYLYMKPLTEKSEIINQNKRYKSYFLQYFR
ncbi:MAG: GNAT family N-acetyltransferase [Candidatus Lokiarchaeota archaeon]|nr:GNAT family N-acetyltransferase [Candidatus Lokiarchaeota archaeon]